MTTVSESADAPNASDKELSPKLHLTLGLALMVDPIGGAWWAYVYFTYSRYRFFAHGVFAAGANQSFSPSACGVANSVT